MNFRTELHLAPLNRKLGTAASVVTVGSCFSEVIGRQLEKYKVNTLTNPFGTIFNPLSACKLLQACCGIDTELANAFVEREGRWYSYDFHSSFSAETAELLYEMLDEVVVKTRRFLKQADLLIITLGTANVFRLNITGETVANCHKMPAANFEKETLNPEEIITAIAETQSMLRELNPNLRMVLSVSPVRHIKDTLELNSVSKSVLRLATHYITQQLPEIFYFPAYELLLDDLRDYRFYKVDMLHPSDMAEDYIWQKFNQAYFDDAFREFVSEWDKVLKAMEHRPFQLATETHQNFVQGMLRKLETLKATVNTEAEIAYFQSQVVEIPKPVELTEAEDEDTEEEAAETESPDEAVAEEIADLPEIDHDEIETKYPARKIKKVAKSVKRDLFKPEAEPEIQEAALQAEGSSAAVTAETPEERKRRKKKERRKKKKKPSFPVNETNPEEQGADTESLDLPVSEDITALTLEIPLPVQAPAAEKGKNKPKKGKGKNTVLHPEIAELQESLTESPAEISTAIATEPEAEPEPRPVVFSKYYLERLQREQEEKAAAKQRTSQTEENNFPADAEAPALPVTASILPVAALATNAPASVPEASLLPKKRGRKSKNQASPVNFPVQSDLFAIPEAGKAEEAAIPEENRNDKNPANAPEATEPQIAAKPKPVKGKKQASQPKKGANPKAVLPESAPAEMAPPAPETIAPTPKPARPVKAAKTRKPKNPEAVTPDPVLENTKPIAAAPAIPISAAAEAGKPKKAARNTKPKATDAPAVIEPVQTVAPIVPEKPAGKRKPVKNKPEATTGKKPAPEAVLQTFNAPKPKRTKTDKNKTAESAPAATGTKPKANKPPQPRRKKPASQKE